MSKLIAENLVDAILNNDEEGIMSSFSATMAERVNDALEVKKVEVASTLITPAAEADQIDEALPQGVAPTYNVHHVDQKDPTKQGKVVGTHSAHMGFIPNKAGQDLGHKAGPNLPDKTRKGDIVAEEVELEEDFDQIDEVSVPYIADLIDKSNRAADYYHTNVVVTKGKSKKHNLAMRNAQMDQTDRLTAAAQRRDNLERDVEVGGAKARKAGLTPSKPWYTGATKSALTKKQSKEIFGEDVEQVDEYNLGQGSRKTDLIGRATRGSSGGGELSGVSPQEKEGLSKIDFSKKDAPAKKPSILDRVKNIVKEAEQIDELKSTTYFNASQARLKQYGDAHKAGHTELADKLHQKSGKLYNAAADQGSAERHNSQASNHNLSPAMARKLGPSAQKKTRFDVAKEPKRGMSSDAAARAGGMSSGAGLFKKV